jgi:hypothetical protein
MVRLPGGAEFSLTISAKITLVSIPGPDLDDIFGFTVWTVNGDGLRELSH